MKFDYRRLWNKKDGKFELGEEMEIDIFLPITSVVKEKNVKNTFMYKNVFSFLYRAQNSLSFLFYLQTWRYRFLS